MNDETDEYWKGYIDKQNEAVEICKICKYKAKADKYDSLVDKIRKKLNNIENELEEKYSADKISVFSGNTYMEKFKLIGKQQALQELLDTNKEEV